VDILGGHEDAIGYNPAQHVLPNATWANNAAELVAVIRGQFKEGADFIKIYETGRDAMRDGKFSTPYQYTEAELRAAVEEAARVGKRVAVHATGEPGTLYAARAGVVFRSIMPSSSAKRPCGSCARNRSSPCPPSPSSNTSPTTPHRRGRPSASAPCSNFTRMNSASSLRRACRWRWVPTSVRFRTARKPASSC
jgi:hypothetical protein